ncbi:MAG: signal peptide peptidase SppA [Ignavibacteriales bacterium]|nr:signal peptide peptidase SppA [Ignavibacteriales bacterium]
MKYIFYILSILVLYVPLVHSQSSSPNYHSQTDLSLTSPGALKFGLYGYDNPALLSYLHQPDILFMWNDEGKKWNNFNRWGLFTGVPNAGFGLIHHRINVNEITNYKLSLAAGDKNASFGLAYGWSTGDKNYFNRSNLVTIGTLFRPIRHASLGIVGTLPTTGDHRSIYLDLAIRPLGNELATIFGDFAIEKYQSFNAGATWSVGTAIEPLSGIRLTGRYFDSKSFTIGFQFSLGNIGLLTQSSYDRDKKYSSQTYGIRIGAFDRTVFGTKIISEKKYVEFNLNGPVRYQRYKWFDKSNTLSGLLSSIKAAKDDPAINGIAINTSGISADREMLWEIREQLKEFKSVGKHVVIFIDRPNIDIYHFASVANKIILDPAGTIMLEGYLMGRTYLKGTLEKLGIGYDEWRFFKYKSAVENLARDKMSEADREQRQKIVDDYYRLAKSDICESRKMQPDKFDELVNDVTMFLPDEAIKEGLTDTIARWEAVPEMIKKLEGEEGSVVGAGSLKKFQLPQDNYWGERPKIAIVYALGACAMDEGINARSLSKVVEAVANDTRVKGVVLRVDSPGGDAMASDYVAEAIRKCKEKKPVIVSQGFVAASGGYWLSMYADTIVAAPNTITGSIGVIGGWAYNKGIKDTLGMTTDHVKAGKHADLGFGFTLPFLGIGIPDRNLTPEEFGKMENMIRSFYKEFVTKVASGRKKKFEDIESIAQGRVWSGYDGKENGLVDVLGGLQKAVQIAKERANICPEQEVDIIELPEKGLFDLSQFMPKLLPFNVQDDPVLQHLKFRLEHNGQPMPIMPIDEIELNYNKY